jgi:hypothetical protein
MSGAVMMSVLCWQGSGGGLEEMFLKVFQRWHWWYQYSDRLVDCQFLLPCICGTVPGYLAPVLSFDGEE